MLHRDRREANLPLPNGSGLLRSGYLLALQNGRSHRHPSKKSESEKSLQWSSGNRVGTHGLERGTNCHSPSEYLHLVVEPWVQEVPYLPAIAMSVSNSGVQSLCHGVPGYGHRIPSL